MTSALEPSPDESTDNDESASPGKRLDYIVAPQDKEGHKHRNSRLLRTPPADWNTKRPQIKYIVEKDEPGIPAAAQNPDIIDKPHAAEDFDQRAHDHDLHEHAECFRRNVVKFRHQRNDRQNKQTGQRPTRRADPLQKPNRLIQLGLFPFADQVADDDRSSCGNPLRERRRKSAATTLKIAYAVAKRGKPCGRRSSSAPSCPAPTLIHWRPPAHSF